MTFQGLWVIFQYFSRQIWVSSTFQESPLYSSTFQACANPATSSANSKVFYFMAFINLSLQQKFNYLKNFFSFFFSKYWIPKENLIKFGIKQWTKPRRSIRNDQLHKRGKLIILQLHIDLRISLISPNSIIHFLDLFRKFPLEMYNHY